MALDKGLSSLSPEAKRKIIARFSERRGVGDKAGRTDTAQAKRQEQIPESYYRPNQFSAYKQIEMHRLIGEHANVSSPFFKVHDGVAADTTVIDGRELLNFSTYNYLGLNGDPRVGAAAAEATERFGTSASASRLVSGERPPHRALEEALADFHGTTDALAFVSGHATNIAVIGTLMGPHDLILHDRLIHNSVLVGAQLTGATRMNFPHNDWRAVDAILLEQRDRYEKILICVEGMYSMDGDICPLDRFIEVKNCHKALLMVDEAHSVGVLGATGRGIGEHAGVAGSDVDIWMGTLSKTFAACGGYIAGEAALIELLRYSAPGFVYSVGMSPPIAAAALESLRIMLREPERVALLQRNSAHCLAAMRACNLDTGFSQGFGVVPVVTGSSMLAVEMSNTLFNRGISVQPIIYPAVEEGRARLRFFLSSTHKPEQIEETADAVALAMATLSKQ
ncbi:MAG: aminotransferase class I/II-fold pyridoxal phosphate-dependent enzyme [Alphaproteobacteria bacterium]